VDLAGPHPVVESLLLSTPLVGGPGGALGLAHHSQIGCLVPTVMLDDVLDQVHHPATDAAERLAAVVVRVERAWPSLALGAAPGITLDLAQRPFPGARDPNRHWAVVGIVM